MNGISYILGAFNLKQSELAKELGVSRMTVSNWVNGKKPLPNERAKEIVGKIPMFRGLKPEYFMKENLTPSEKMDIDIIELHVKSEPIEIEDSYTDDEGNEQTYTKIIYTNQNEIGYLSQERDRIEQVEQLVKDVNLLLIYEKDDVGTEYELLFNHGTNLNTLKRVVGILQNPNKEHQLALKIMLEILSFDENGMGNPYFNMMGNHQKRIAKDLVGVLVKNNIVKNEFFKV
ncbi:UNVERIFIED_ORG: transcriptional regulator with XRE-family HTH domain [Peribacillus simplex]